MRRLHVDVSNFTQEFISLNGKHTFNISSTDMIRAIISIGYSDWRNALSGGFSRYAEILHHAFGTIAYTEEVQGNLALRRSFHSLDMSEKNPITYRLGMGVTKLIAEKLLEVPWLLHVDELVTNGFATITSGTRERGDLAGLDKLDRWHVLEGKGRSNKLSNNIITKGKNQAGRIQTINGIAPKTKSVCASYFQDNRTDAYLVDPEDGDDEIPTNWLINKNKYLYYYYRRILEKVNSRNSKTYTVSILDKNFQFKVFMLKNLPYHIGIYKPIFENFNKESIDFLDELKVLQEFVLVQNKENITNISHSIGLDGIAILE
jgi:hypothetical protein